MLWSKLYISHVFMHGSILVTIPPGNLQENVTQNSPELSVN